MDINIMLKIVNSLSFSCTLTFKIESFFSSHSEPNVESILVLLALLLSRLKDVALTMYLNLEDLAFSFVNKDSIALPAVDKSVVSEVRSCKTSSFEIG